MGARLDDLPFDAWVRHCFDHPVREPRWYFDLEAPFWAGPAPLTIAYVTRLLEDPLPPLAPYDDAQLAQGFWYLVANGASDCMFALSDGGVPAAERARCLRAFTSVFRQLFATRCSPHLSHLDEPGAAPLNLSCYMWWDLLPFGAASDDAPGRPLVRTALAVMAEILAVDQIACQESALHGLGHWHRDCPGEVEAIVDGFLGTHADARAELLRYARSARSGCVQ